MVRGHYRRWAQRDEFSLCTQGNEKLMADAGIHATEQRREPHPLQRRLREGDIR